MTDRVPGAPGQYQAVLSAEALAKMQAGEQFTITLTRDDRPIEEGTPFSKAAVLPDALAEILCPEIEDPTPADALAALLPLNGGTMEGDIDMDGHSVSNVNNMAVRSLILNFLNGVRVRAFGNHSSASKDFELDRSGYSAYLFVAHSADDKVDAGSGSVYFVATGQETTTVVAQKIWGADNLSFACPDENKLTVTLSKLTVCFAISLDSSNVA